MCGIAGLFHRDGRRVDAGQLLAMTRVLRHRGPDEEGYFLNSRAASSRAHGARFYAPGMDGGGETGLGHRRLAIIDVASGQQPLSNEDGSVWITFNGEIYNYLELQRELVAAGHEFKTQSDTETIVHGWEEWGEKLPSRLRGMFAFAVWDQRKGVLFLARDRLGQKPLYYAAEPSGRFSFASELKSLLQLPGLDRSVDPIALSDYLSLLYVPAPRSIFRAIRKLPAGHQATVTRDSVAIRQYWDLPFVPASKATQAAQEERIVELLSEATRMRMMSEVPLGAFLSGGIDSSAVVAFMADASSNPVRTSSISFSVAEYDESRYAHQVAELFGTQHAVHQVTPEAIPVIETLAWHYDEPFADSSAVPTYYVSKMARESVTVALSGDGGDENFAGYRRYWFHERENRMRRRIPAFLRRPLVGIHRRVPFLPGQAFASQIVRDPVSAYTETVSAWGEEQKRELLHPSIVAEVGDHRTEDVLREHYDRAQAPDHLSRILYVDTKTYLCDDICTKVDRASMAVSLEVRCPLLDHAFMEFVASIPSGRKLKGNDKKHIFKRSLQRHLPDEILFRPKMGFGVPVEEWMRGEVHDYARELVLDAEGTRTFFRRPVLESVWNRFQAGEADLGPCVWGIMTFNLWHRRFVERAVPAASLSGQP